MMETIVTKLAEQAYHETQRLHLNCGLLGGDFGNILLLLLTGQENEGTCGLHRTLQSALIPSCVTTYCNGLAGLGVGLMWLERNGIIEGVTDNLTDFDYRLLQSMRTMLRNGNIDFLHGAVGHGLYFVDRYATNPGVSHMAIAEIVDYMSNSAIHHDDGSICLVYDREDVDKRYNIALSHGLSGTMLFLCRVVHLNNIDTELCGKVKSLLTGMGKFLVNQRQDIKRYGSYFPTFPIGDKQPAYRMSRLAWCYGDLGILLALMKVSELTDDDDLYHRTLHNLKVTAKYRRDLKINMVHDSCICHGSSGVAQIFKYLFQHSHCEEFRDAFEYWRKITLDFAAIEDNGQVHFKNYNTVDQCWNIENCILEGDAGIGLFLNENDNLLNHILLLS